MLRSAAFASFLGVFVLASQPAGAEDFFLFTRHPKVDPRVATAGPLASLRQISIRTGRAVPGRQMLR